MNVFVLCAGRCGSVTFTEACRHMVNYSVGHESRAGMLGNDRFAFRDNHIEVDPRLVWFAGTIDRLYGNAAFYVHLERDADAVADSHVRKVMLCSTRDAKGDLETHKDNRLILNHYALGIARVGRQKVIDVAHDYVQTVTANIELFLKDKTNKIHIDIETAQDTFPDFWKQIGAQGDLGKALEELKVKHNANNMHVPVV